MDKGFLFHRPRITKFLRETVAKHLRENLTELKDERFRTRVSYADDYEKPVKKRMDMLDEEGIAHWREVRI